MYATYSKYLSASMHLYIAIHIHHISALPQNGTVISESRPQPAASNDSTLLATTLNICSTILALGSLIVAIVGVIQLRKRGNSSHEVACSNTPRNSYTTVQIGDTASDPSAHLESEPSSGISTSVAPTRDSQDSNTTGVSLLTLGSGEQHISLDEAVEGNTKAQSPIRPPLALLRLRSSRLLITSTALKMSSLRTSTF